MMAAAGNTRRGVVWFALGGVLVGLGFLVSDAWLSGTLWPVGAASMLVGAGVWGKVVPNPSAPKGPLYCVICGHPLERIADGAGGRWYCSRCKVYRDDSPSRALQPHHDDSTPYFR